MAVYGLVKEYDGARAVDDVTVEVGKGELVSLLGPSGCGKTTTLRAIAGFVEPTAGSITVRGRDITAEPPHRRNTAMVFQSYALFPHLSVERNIGFGLRMRKVPVGSIKQRVAAILSLVQLDHLGGRYPRQLSGGQQQRVALARALVVEPDVLLLDEPLSNLDARLREEMRTEIRRLVKQTGATALYVTHDQAEALSIADRVVIMEQGKVAQVGPPDEVYEYPESLFVATFMGEANLLAGTIERLEGRQAQVRIGNGLGSLVTTAPEWAQADQPVTVMVRPERVSLRPAAGDATMANGRAAMAASLRGRLIETTYLGFAVRYSVQLDDGSMIRAHLPPGSVPATTGGTVIAGWETTFGRLLPGKPLP